MAALMGFPISVVIRRPELSPRCSSRSPAFRIRTDRSPNDRARLRRAASTDLCSFSSISRSPSGSNPFRVSPVAGFTVAIAISSAFWCAILRAVQARSILLHLNRTRGVSMNHAKNLRTALLVFALAILVPLAALGQSSTGAISGTVTDANGGAMPGVTVTATNIATHAIRTVVSNGVGHYEVPLLPPGVYKVVAELSGFQPVSSVMNINVGTDATFDVKLKPGVTETVTVTASAPMVETTKSEISSVVNEKAIQNLPTNGRNFIDFVLTTPGVVRDGTRAGDISFAGQRGTLNSMVVDGANNDNTFFGQTTGRTGSGRAPYQFSQDAVKEFQVNTNSYSAEYGRAGGAVINVVTKSGTNECHGSVFDYYRDKRLNANDYINVINKRAKSPYHFDQYGFSAGGPIVRDKHFFFANWDRQRNSVPNLVVIGGGRITNFPTDAASQQALSTLQGLANEYSRQQNQDVYLLKTDHELLVNQHL